MNNPMVCLYNLDTQKEAKIKAMCLLQGIRVKTVAKEDYRLRLSVLTGQDKENPDVPLADCGDFSDEMILMVNFTNAAVTHFLQEYRRRKIPAVALKAVLTATNAVWNSKELHEELLKEHEAMLRGRAAHSGKQQ